MLWSELRDLETESTLWEIPGHRTKNKKNHLVPLAPEVRNILLSLPRVGSLLFSTTGETPGFGKAKARLDALIDAARALDGLEPMAPWTLHDLRRTMVTAMNEKLGVAPHVVEAVVNHMSGLAKAGIAGVCNRALYLDERRAALSGWARYLRMIAAEPCVQDPRPFGLKVPNDLA
jgi:integrase